MIKIRRFEAQDQAQVKKLITGILGSEFAMDQKAYLHSDIDKIADVYSGAREVFFVGEDESGIVGTIGVKEESSSTAILRRLFVDSKFRGEGYGRLLFEKALKFCKEKKYHETVFHASTAMRAAVALCKSKGFIEKQKLDFDGIEIVRFARPI